MRLIRPTKIRAAGVYFSSVPCDLKNACDSLSPTTSHNWSRVGHSTWFDNKDALKCFCFLTGRGLSPGRAVPARVVLGPWQEEYLGAYIYNFLNQVLSTTRWVVHIFLLSKEIRRNRNTFLFRFRLICSFTRCLDFFDFLSWFCLAKDRGLN